ncbi:uncharacterized protein LOC120780913 [Bactrocera tryoni]|nr:uncharacterized protein LOC120780913 [Bactrocera tryoni]
MVLQCLEIKVSMKRQWKKFELVDIVKSEDIFRNLSLAEIRSHMRVKSMFSFTTKSIVEDESQSDEDTYISVQQQRKKIRTLEKQCALGNPDENFELSSELGSLSSLISYSTLKPEGHEHNEDSRSEENGEFHISPGEESSCSYDYFSKSESNTYNIGNSLGKKLMETKIENHFIEVGTISKGGIFGLGEAMKHRIIMAETKVQCLVIPRYWLFQDEQNPANMWQRKKIQLGFTLPSREALFSLFQNSRKWQNFKKGIVSSFRSLETKVQDIPIMGRIMSCDQ